jgi:hypothetical protein
MPIGSFEPFNKGIVAWFTGLDVSQLNGLIFAPSNSAALRSA